MKAPNPARGDLLVGAPSCAVYRKDVALSFFRSLSPHSANGHVCFKNVLQLQFAEKQKKHVVDCGSNQSSILAQPRREPHSHKVTWKAGNSKQSALVAGVRCATSQNQLLLTQDTRYMSTEALTFLKLFERHGWMQSCCDELNQLGQPHSVVALLEPKKIWTCSKDHFISSPNAALSKANHLKTGMQFALLGSPMMGKMNYGAVTPISFPWLNKGYTTDQQPEQDMGAVDGWEKHWSGKKVSESG